MGGSLGGLESRYGNNSLEHGGLLGCTIVGRIYVIQVEDSAGEGESRGPDNVSIVVSKQLALFVKAFYFYM